MSVPQALPERNMGSLFVIIADMSGFGSDRNVGRHTKNLRAIVMAITYNYTLKCAVHAAMNEFADLVTDIFSEQMEISAK